MKKLRTLALILVCPVISFLVCYYSIPFLAASIDAEHEMDKYKRAKMWSDLTETSRDLKNLKIQIKQVALNQKEAASRIDIFFKLATTLVVAGNERRRWVYCKTPGGSQNVLCSPWHMKPDLK